MYATRRTLVMVLHHKKFICHMKYILQTEYTSHFAEYKVSFFEVA